MSLTVGDPDCPGCDQLHVHAIIERIFATIYGVHEVYYTNERILVYIYYIGYMPSICKCTDDQREYDDTDVTCIHQHLI